MGADNLASLHRWQRWRCIAALVPIAVVDRPGWHLKALSAPAARALAARRLPASAAGRLVRTRPPAWVYLATRLSSLSSTEIRGQS
jgi:nicotinate-nucleotide adenylyltransferase